MSDGKDDARQGELRNVVVDAWAGGDAGYDFISDKYSLLALQGTNGSECLQCGCVVAEGVLKWEMNSPTGTGPRAKTALAKLVDDNLNNFYFLNMRVLNFKVRLSLSLSLFFFFIDFVDTFYGR